MTSSTSNSAHPGREAGFRQHPAVLVTAQRILDAEPSVVHVVPLTSTIRPFGSEITIEPDDTNGLDVVSAAQCQHIRAISPTRGRIIGSGQRRIDHPDTGT
ncbi:MAG: type II toxin-antitoxin system PemK/MazF family toxin [Acidimicrobiales bacterium]